MHRGREVYVWTPSAGDGRHIWLYTVNGRLLTSSQDDYADEISALDAGRAAAVEHVERLAAAGQQRRGARF